MQVLFQLDVGKAKPEAAIAYVERESPLKLEDLEFARKVVLGTIARRKEIDRVISRLSHDWELHRMAAVDRNLLRLALFEILYCPDIPPAVSVNEAVELAKIYGGDDSGRFVNGILGQVVRDPAAFLQSPT